MFVKKSLHLHIWDNYIVEFTIYANGKAKYPDPPSASIQEIYELMTEHIDLWEIIGGSLESP